MSETFVDLTYRGLPLGRRIKLTRVRATTGYLEHPTPMPVGSELAIATDDGLAIDAVVEAIHEQVGGSDQPPGMRVRPAFATDQLATWWASRAEPEPAPEVAAPVAPPAMPDRARPITVRPRSATIPEPLADVPAAAPALPIHTIPGTLQVPPPAAPRGGAATRVMPAVDQELLAQLTKDNEIEELTRRTGEHPVVDDGMRTSVMDAVDPAALGLDVSMLSSESGPIATVDDDELGPGESGPIPTQGNGDDKKPKGGGTVKKRKKRR